MELQLGKANLTAKIPSGTKTSSTRVAGFSVGLMIKVSRGFYLVLPEVKVLSRGSHFDFEKEGDYLFGARYPWIASGSAGLLFNFGKRI